LSIIFRMKSRYLGIILANTRGFLDLIIVNYEV